jgi:hypothetical protein
MTNTEINHQTALAFFEAFKKLPDEVRIELKKMIGSVRSKNQTPFKNETDYLFRNEDSKKTLLKSMKNIQDKQAIVSYSPYEWADFTKRTLEKIGE